MSYKKIFWGVILVVLGTALILKNLGFVWFSWYGLWNLWPVFLILWGISLIPVKDYIKLIVSLLVIAVSIAFLYKERDAKYHGFRIDWDQQDDETCQGESNQVLGEAMDSTISVANLTFDAAAGEFKIDQTSLKLIEFEKYGDVGTYSMEIQKKSDTAIIDLNMHGHNVTVGDKHGNDVVMKLNPLPFWNFDLDVGAASLNLDLSKFKVADFNLDGGASSIDLTLGNLQKESSLDFETGASSITIRIPKDAGCELKTNTFLTSRNLDGFSKIESGHFKTANFETSQQKIRINIESAISSLDIQRY